MTLTFLHEQPVRQREYGNEDECIKTSNALLGVAHYDQWLQSPHNQHRWAMFGLYYETAVFWGSTIVYLFLSCGRDIMFFPMYCVHLYMNKHAPPVLIRHVFFTLRFHALIKKVKKKKTPTLNYLFSKTEWVSLCLSFMSNMCTDSVFCKLPLMYYSRYAPWQRTMHVERWQKSASTVHRQQVQQQKMATQLIENTEIKM